MTEQYRLFDPGEKVFGGKYQIIAHRAQGGTANVYEAHQLAGHGISQRVVALKVALPELSAIMKARFLDEIDNLSLLNQLERVAQGAQPSDDRHPHYVALLYDFDRRQEYIAQEYIQGESLGEVGILPLENNRDKERPGEQLALMMTAQFSQVLAYLHDDLQSTYADMKIENIWWVESDDSIRVTDWNVIDSVANDPSGIDRDLFNLARYLLGMLTGVVPDTLSNTPELRRIINPTRIDGWEDITFGTRQLLLKALNSTREVRFQSARELKAALDELLTMWAGNRRVHELQIQEQIEAARRLETSVDRDRLRDDETLAQVEQVRLAYQEARTLFDIARKKHGTAIREATRGNFERQISRGLDTSDVLNIGRELFLAGDYLKAIDKFEEGQRRGNPIHFRRLANLARAGIDSDALEAYAEALLVAVVEMNRDNFGEGLRLLKTAEEFVNSPKYRELLLEAEAWVSFNQADDAMAQENYSDAYAAYIAANEAFQQLPFADWMTETPNFQELIEQSREQMETVEKARNQLKSAEQAIQDRRISDAIRAYRTAFDANPDLPWTSVNEQAELLLASGDIEDAHHLLKDIMQFKPNQYGIKRRWQLVDSLVAIQTFNTNGNYAEAVKQLNRLLTRPRKELAATGGRFDELLTESFTGFASTHGLGNRIRLLVKNVEDYYDADLATQLKATIEVLSKEETQNRGLNVQEKLEIVDNLLRNSDTLEDYDMAVLQLNNARQIAEGIPDPEVRKSQLDVIQSRQRDLDDNYKSKIAQLEGQERAEAEARDKLLNDVSFNLGVAQNYVEMIRNLPPERVQSPDMQLILNEAFGKRLQSLSKAQASVGQLLALAPDNSSYKELNKRVQEEIGDDQLALQALESAHLAYRNGELETAKDRLEEASQRMKHLPEFERLNELIRETEALLKILGDFFATRTIKNDIYKGFQNAAEAGIPTPYWSYEERLKPALDGITRESIKYVASAKSVEEPQAEENSKKALGAELLLSFVKKHLGKGVENLVEVDVPSLVEQFNHIMTVQGKTSQRMALLTGALSGSYVSNAEQVPQKVNQWSSALMANQARTKVVARAARKPIAPLAALLSLFGIIALIGVAALYLFISQPDRFAAIAPDTPTPTVTFTPIPPTGVPAATHTPEPSVTPLPDCSPSRDYPALSMRTEHHPGTPILDEVSSLISRSDTIYVSNDGGCTISNMSISLTYAGVQGAAPQSEVRTDSTAAESVGLEEAIIQGERLEPGETWALVVPLRYQSRLAAASQTGEITINLKEVIGNGNVLDTEFGSLTVSIDLTSAPEVNGE